MSILHRRSAVIARHALAIAAGAAVRNLPCECARASEREPLPAMRGAASLRIPPQPAAAAPIPPPKAAKRKPAKKAARKR